MSPRRILRLVTALAWAAATLVMASSIGSETRTGGFLLPLLRDTLGFSAEAADAVHLVLRKLGHVVAYAIFATLVWWAQPGRRRHVLFTLGAALALAVADEALQSRHPDRGGRVEDVLVDLLGASLVVLYLRKRAHGE